MNKTVSICLIIVLSILTLVLTGLFIFLMSGNSFNWSFSFNTYSEKLVESKEVSDVASLNVDSQNVDVLFEKSNDDKVYIELYSENNVDHSIDVVDSKVNVKFYDKEVFRFFKKNSRILIKLPENYENELVITSTTGDIKFQSFEKLSPIIKLGTGDIKADKLNEVEITSTTGDIKISELNAINCKTVTGDVKINRVNIANIHGTTGDVKIQEINYSADITLTTGNVKITKFDVKENSSINLTTGDVKIESHSGAYIETTNNVGDVKVNNNDRTLEKTLKISVRTGDIKVN